MRESRVHTHLSELDDGFDVEVGEDEKDDIFGEREERQFWCDARRERDLLVRGQLEAGRRHDSMIAERGVRNRHEASRHTPTMSK